ncbi:unnamed protein product [Spirodela intermedia]|uniref:Uncharacterized protein n=1 Tax=Spirodela intermedia TaxID=51605 RepID=A0A7I8KSS0_SPIIN|nr:unnamed protein product [Spirodela intermedia]
MFNSTCRGLYDDFSCLLLKIIPL